METFLKSRQKWLIKKFIQKSQIEQKAFLSLKHFFLALKHFCQTAKLFGLETEIIFQEETLKNF